MHSAHLFHSPFARFRLKWTIHCTLNIEGTRGIRYRVILSYIHSNGKHKKISPIFKLEYPISGAFIRTVLRWSLEQHNIISNRKVLFIRFSSVETKWRVYLMRGDVSFSIIEHHFICPLAVRLSLSVSKSYWLTPTANITVFPSDDNLFSRGSLVERSSGGCVGMSCNHFYIILNTSRVVLVEFCIIYLFFIVFIWKACFVIAFCSLP